MSQKHRVAVAAAAALLIVVALLVPMPMSAAAPQTHSIVINARAFAFEPSILRVHRGDTVQLHLESLDATHGLFIDGYNVDIQAEPGKSADVTFVADRAGTFKFRCSVSCGTLHPFMIGELNVDPVFPFARATVATLIAAIGALAFFWRGG
jgi:heme/copper-type cytochrome/quinol oxidase subunit 2